MRARLSLGHGRVGGLFVRVFLSLVVLGMGCRKDPQTGATEELTTSFDGSPAQETVMAAKAAFEEGKYRDSLLLLHKVASRPDLTGRQKNALGGIAGQVMQAVHNDPELSADIQLHRSMELLIQRTMGAP